MRIINPFNRTIVNKLIPIILFMLFAFSANAQSQDDKQQMQVLSQRVDSLAHELSYLKLTYEINELNSDLIQFKDDVSITALNVQLNLYNRNFDRELGRAYQENLKSCENQRKSFDNLVKAKKDMFAISIHTLQFTDIELNILNCRYELIDDILDSLDHSMNVLKIAIDAYTEAM